MKQKLPINDIIMWVTLAFILSVLLTGCSPTSREVYLELEYKRFAFNAIKIVMLKNEKIDSLEIELEKCKFNRFLESKNER